MQSTPLYYVLSWIGGNQLIAKFIHRQGGGGGGAFHFFSLRQITSEILQLHESMKVNKIYKVLKWQFVVDYSCMFEKIPI